MARSAATVIENNFSKGLITEATGLNYPENSCIETWDCEFDFYGRVARRLGFDRENGAQSLVVDKTDCAINRYHWKNVTGDGLVSLVVVQIGGTLYFYDASNVNSLSASLLISTLPLSTFASDVSVLYQSYDCQFADGLSKLYVTHPYMNNFYVTYNPTTKTVSGTQYNLRIRDFEGDINDTLPVDTRPAVNFGGLTPQHLYNLYNQGWPTDNGYLVAWDTARTDMPSNCDVWWDFKNATDAFDTTTVPNSGRGNSPAPKGHLLYSVYNLNRSNALAGATNTTSGNVRTSTCAFHAGRVFYAGINTTGYTSKIYFSQIIQQNVDVGKCYQANDPTSEDLFDLLPADGGVISIPEAGTIYKLFSAGNGLLVFAYRGVWFISGSQGIGFTAVDFTVSKLASIRTVSASSFVDVNGTPMWWNTDGIWTVASGNGAPQVTSMSLSTIQTFFNGIPNTSKTTARGYFNPLEQKVQWLFSTNTPKTISDQYTFNAVLNYNVLTSAFYPWSASSPNVTFHDLIVVDGLGGTQVQNPVVDNLGNSIVSQSGDVVVAYQLTNTAVQPKSKFFIHYTDPVSGITGFTWAETLDETYTDWSSVHSSQDYTSYFITGYKIHGNALMKFAPMYVNIYNEGTGQAYIQGIWDYAMTSSTGRYSTKQLLTFDDPDYALQSRRVKIRGQGKTLQYFVKSLPGQPFNINGWASLETGNTQP